jgi:hypothetical protein
MIQRLCGRRVSLVDIAAQKTFHLDDRMLLALRCSKCWEDAAPSTVVAMLEILSNCSAVNMSEIIPHASPSVAAILPTLSLNEARRLNIALDKLHIYVPQSLRNFGDDVPNPNRNINDLIADSEIEVSEQLRCHAVTKWQSLSISSCAKLHSFFTNDPDVSRAIGMRCLVDVRNNELSTSKVDLFLSVDHQPLRNAVVNQLFQTLPTMGLADVVEVIASIHRHCHKNLPLLLLKETSRVAEELISPDSESSIVLQLLALPHQRTTKEKVLRLFEESIRVIDLELHLGCELFSHLADAVESGVAVSQHQIEILSARLFLGVGQMSSGTCCTALEDTTVLTEASYYVPDIFSVRIQNRFFTTFRNEFVDGSEQGDDTVPLSLLQRFVRCATFHTKGDTDHLVELQQDCLKCRWRKGPMLLEVSRQLRLRDALFDQFSR